MWRQNAEGWGRVDPDERWGQTDAARVSPPTSPESLGARRHLDAGQFSESVIPRAAAGIARRQKVR